MATQRTFAQIPANRGYYRTIQNTMWLYPPADVAQAMSNTTYKYTFDGTNIVCPDMSNLLGLYGDIFQQTTISQPNGNQGFTLGAGTFLQNFGKKLYWQTPNANIVVKWELVQQLTDQSNAYVPIPGNSPPRTTGYVTTFNYEGYGPVLDASLVVLNG